MKLFRILLQAAAVLLLPAAALAHPGSAAEHGLSDGFQHPLLGWDHLLAMLTVGVWAAQQRGRTAVAIPAAFLAAMSLGGLAGARGMSLPGVEAVVALSVVVFGVLVGMRARFGTRLAVLLVGVFAFFHGFAHGSELPPSASFVGFGLGFLAATAVLHGLGWMLARLLVALVAALLWSFAALGETDTGSPSGEGDGSPEVAPTPGVEEIVIEGRATSLVGVAESASEGSIGAEQLSLRPTLRAGELLETVPGVIVTQHAGGGKANQYFLRGFNLDHGTDFATSIDGVPVNLPSHGHGQGYTDLNILIPELVEQIHFRKGPYYADVGDFASAGSAEIQLVDHLDESLVHLEGGSFGHLRGVAASSLPVADGDLLYGIDLLHQDGPWKQPDDFVRGTGILRYSRGSRARGFRATATGYRGDWDSSDQIAESAVPIVGRFGSLDDSTGGHSQRYSLAGDWHSRDDDGATAIQAWGFYYDLDLFSDFTYFLNDPVLGDQFEQRDERWTAGLDARRSWFGEILGISHETTLGFQFRNDSIHNALLNTRDRVPVDKVDRNGDPIPKMVRNDHILETSFAPFLESEIRWLDWLRSSAGVRFDSYRFDVDDDRHLNSGQRWDTIASPKLSLVLGPRWDTELYLQGGLGFHSNDARGVNTGIDPGTGTPVTRADPLVRTQGAEVGLRHTGLPGLQSTLAFWWLDIDSELVFVGDAGTTEPSHPSRRYGVEFANYWTPTDWLTVDADLSLSHARFRDDPPEGDHIPGAIESVVAAGITAHDWHGLHASLRLRYFGPRPLKEDDSFRSDETILLSAGVGWEFWRSWTVSAEIFNLLDRKDSDIEYAYESAISPAAPILEQKHFHPVEPLSARVGLTAKF